MSSSSKGTTASSDQSWLETVAGFHGGEAVNPERKGKLPGVVCKGIMASSRRDQVKGYSFSINSGQGIIVNPINPEEIRQEKGEADCSSISKLMADPLGRPGAMIDAFECVKVKKIKPEGLKVWDRFFVFEGEQEKGIRVYRRFFLFPGASIPIKNSGNTTIDSMPNIPVGMFDVRDVAISAKHERGPNSKDPSKTDDYTNTIITTSSASRRTIAGAAQIQDNVGRVASAVFNMSVSGYRPDEELVPAMRVLSEYSSGFVLRLGGPPVVNKENGEYYPGQVACGYIVGESPKSFTLEDKVEAETVVVSLRSDFLTWTVPGQVPFGVSASSGGKRKAETPVSGGRSLEWSKYQFTLNTGSKYHVYGLERDLGLGARTASSIYSWWRNAIYLESYIIACPDFDDVRMLNTDPTVMNIQVSTLDLFVSAPDIIGHLLPLGSGGENSVVKTLVPALMSGSKYPFDKKIAIPEDAALPRQNVIATLNAKGFCMVGRQPAAVIRELLEFKDLCWGILPQLWKLIPAARAEGFDLGATADGRMESLLKQAELDKDLRAMLDPALTDRKKVIQAFFDDFIDVFGLGEGDQDIPSIWHMVVYRQGTTRELLGHYVNETIREAKEGKTPIPTAVRPQPSAPPQKQPHDTDQDMGGASSDEREPAGRPVDLRDAN